MINEIIKKTQEYISEMPKSDRKKYGQFFTSKETAIFMADLFVIDSKIKTISILDPGTGSGILSCALVERLQGFKEIKKINLTCYENDENILELLKNNLEYIKENSHIEFCYIIKNKNYLTEQASSFNSSDNENKYANAYDIVIGNPPYMKISKNTLEAKAMPTVCYGAPNLYFLFASMSLFNLKENGELVYIVPRSWTSGAYFKKFREYFLEVGKLLHIHLFISRNDVFDSEDVLQETIIIKIKKVPTDPQKVIITSSRTNNDFQNITKLEVPYDVVVSGKEKYVYLTTSIEEINVLNKLKKWDKTLPSIGLRMKTGLTVDFRNREVLRSIEEEGAVPLFYAQHIKNGRVVFPIQKENEYVVTQQKGLLQDNKNYLFVKRFTSKEEPRRLQCGIYLAKKYNNYTKISTQNKLNFIDGLSVELSECVVYGLYALFNSSSYDVYYRVLNGSTQVNSTEVNSMPVPELNIIKEIGKRLLKSKDLSEENCNNILEEYYV